MSYQITFVDQLESARWIARVFIGVREFYLGIQVIRGILQHYKSNPISHRPLCYSVVLTMLERLDRHIITPQAVLANTKIDDMCQVRRLDATSSVVAACDHLGNSYLFLSGQIQEYLFSLFVESSVHQSDTDIRVKNSEIRSVEHLIDVNLREWRNVSGVAKGPR